MINTDMIVDGPVVDIDVDDKSDAKKKSTKAKKPGGTFASFGLSRPILTAVERKGYKLCTPIQRKCIPAIMTGRDVVAMARTGSGKSAAFLLPMIDRLKMRQPKTAIRALVISPTRELATQTFKFARDFSKYTNLITKLIIGGESISKDFETVTSCPDILIATPGRLAHVLVEMKHKLNEVEIVVFDEADRLFEPGFKEMEQVNEICSRLPESKQTLLFSATMPGRLAEFAKAGLKNPNFIRLDVESNLSDTLKIIHLHCNQHEKFAILIHLLKNLAKDEMVVVFMPTKHHIEYAKLLLDNSRIDSTHVYSSMDPEARKINIDKFVKKRMRVMLVTDIAARGIDIPLLDVVINFNFPSKPKLFIHRVGRVARAGKFGSAISLVAHDETPYLHALHLFFGMSVTVAAQTTDDENERPQDLKSLPDRILGSVPRFILDDESEILNRWHEHNDDLKAMVKVCDNAMKPYLKTREPPAPNSVKASKEIHQKVIGEHPLYSVISKTDEPERKDVTSKQQNNFLDRIKSYKPQATIFEVGHIKGAHKTEAFDVMQKKRQFHDKATKKRKQRDDDDEEVEEGENDLTNTSQAMELVKKDFEDSKFYLKYQPDDYVKEKGLEISKENFHHDLKRSTMDLVADDENHMKRQRHQTVWDRKKKKYVTADQLSGDSQKVKKIKTESGAYISASYQSGLYDKWKKQTKYDQHEEDDDDSDREKSKTRGSKRGKDVDKLRAKLKPNNRRSELKNTEVMFKEKGIKEKREAILRLKTQAKAQRNSQRTGKPANSGKFNKHSKGGKGGKTDRDGGGKGGSKGGRSARGGKSAMASKGGKRGGGQGGKQSTTQKQKGYKPPTFGASGKKNRRPRH